MHEDAVEPSAGKLCHLAAALGGLANHRVAHGADDPGALLCRPRGLEQRHQLEAELPATEGELLDDEDVRTEGLELGQQPGEAMVAPGVVDGTAGVVHDLGEARVRRGRRRQKDAGAAEKVDALDRRAAEDDGDVEPGFAHRLCQDRSALQVADAEQMLDIEHHSPGHATALLVNANRCCPILSAASRRS